jgi:antitoxin component YwqK of YwqJK toxin-antitoxin module
MVNNRFLRFYVIVMLLLLVCGPMSFGQEFINIRKISHSKGDTMVVAGILADVKIEKVNPSVFYYWYTNGQILVNQGGYSGNLLHGEYVEYSPYGHLILKGMFEKGVKSGSWTIWYPNGSIKEKIHYEAGVLEGKSIRYGQNGKMYYSANYKDGSLHGEMTKVERDTLYRVVYRKGKEKKKVPLYVFEQ